MSKKTVVVMPDTQKVLENMVLFRTLNDASFFTLNSAVSV